MLLFDSYLVMVIYLILSNQEIRNFGFNSIPVLGTSSREKKKKTLALISQQIFTSMHIYSTFPCSFSLNEPSASQTQNLQFELIICPVSSEHLLLVRGTTTIHPIS